MTRTTSSAFGKIRRFAGRMLLVLVALIGLYLLAAWLLAKVPVNAGAAQPKDGIPIYLLSNGVHTDLVLPLANAEHDWRSLLDRDLTTKPDSLARWVGFGWGDKGFYLNTPTWADFDLATAFAALLWDETVIRVDYRLRPGPGETCGSWQVGEEDYRRIAALVRDTLRQSQGRPVQAGPGYGDRDIFYGCRWNCWDPSPPACRSPHG